MKLVGKTLNENTTSIPSSMDCYDFDAKKTVQVKASTLKIDCSSFGPKTEFDRLVYIDFSDCHKFKLYIIDDKSLYAKLMINKKKEKQYYHKKIKEEDLDFQL